MPDRDDHDELNNPISTAIQNSLNEFNSGMARAIDAELQAKFGMEMGFVIMTFTFGSSGVMTYASNAQREDIVGVLKEFLDRWERQKEEK